MMVGPPEFLAISIPQLLHVIAFLLKLKQNCLIPCLGTFIFFKSISNRNRSHIIVPIASTRRLVYYFLVEREMRGWLPRGRLARGVLRTSHRKSPQTPFRDRVATLRGLLLHAAEILAAPTPARGP